MRCENDDTWKVVKQLHAFPRLESDSVNDAWDKLWYQICIDPEPEMFSNYLPSTFVDFEIYTEFENVNLTVQCLHAWK